MKTVAKRFLRSMVHVATLGALLFVLVLPIARTPGTSPSPVHTADMKLVSCDIPSGLVFVRADAPTKIGGGRVTFTGYVETPRDYCHDEVRILGQRKVCGGWGCHYRNIESSPYVEFDRATDLKLFHDCQSGTHRYRTVMEYTAPNVANPQNRFFVMDKKDIEISC